MEEVEHFTDPLDVGAQVAEAERQRCEFLQRDKAKPKQVRNPDGSWPCPDCVECGEPIVQGRLNLGFDTCIDCAQLAEIKGKKYAI